ncbi:acyl-CoA dehydrogenase family protein [Streptomyces beihaiensis]|uniref:Acyl-CoA/acyl-ACP dehydrogenase n=1 Tax=Streptomyces beihaiensis TaxID=2984495 RepID=A0ABT3TQA8_9ACTN|nr:acyl-CoA dehydrogenase family protein [Streptomyces beihaiensis]MCX3059224.1 acyl-CoA/acyl-ACP dehydrogenase [Streptomyces beihaiensis]
MDAKLSEEQQEIRRTLRALTTKRCTPDEVKAAVRTPVGYDPALWRTLSRELGLPGLALPDRHGGVGASVTELALAEEELGRVLAPTPLLASSGLVAPLVAALGGDAQREALLPRIADGTLTAALAVPGTGLATALGLVADNTSDWAGGGRAGGIQARRGTGPGPGVGAGPVSASGPRADGGTGWRLYGQAEQVLDGHSAGLLVVAAHTGGFARSRTLLFLVRGDAPGLVRVRQTALDETRPQARVELRDVAAELLGGGEGRGGADVAAALRATGDAVAALLAAEAVGAADRALERTVEYVKEREQFGRPIGSFQAVKHRLADVYVRVQAARSAAYYAAWAAAAARESEPGERVGGLALAQALEALRTSAAEAVQLHGGIGFTWEHDAHLYLKRAAGDELLFGPAHLLRARAAQVAELFPGSAGAARAVSA